MNTSSVTKRRIGIFGGSFNPPHVAHLIVAELVRDQFGLDGILWLPNYQSPLKRHQDAAAPEHRLAMTRLAVKGNDTFHLSEMEIRHEGVSYTVDSLRTLQDSNSKIDYSFIIGSDGLAHFESWREPQEILERVRLIVFPRPGTERVDPPAGFEDRIVTAEAPLLEISGTVIRERIQSGKSFRYLVPETVHDYILEKGLYGAPGS